MSLVRTKLKSHWKLLIALASGIILGTLLHPAQDWTWLQFLSTHVFQSVGQVFLRLIFMVVVPLVFSALVLGVFELGQARGLGRVASKTLLYTILCSSASVAIGVLLVNIFRPGDGFQIRQEMINSQSASVEKITANAQNAKPWSQTLVELIPKNPLDSALRALEGEMISLMVFALIFGLAMSLVLKEDGGRKPVLLKFFEELMAISMKIVDFAMNIAPIAVFCIVFNTAYKLGIEVFSSLFLYAGLVVSGLLIQQFLVYAPLLKSITGRSPWDFFSKCREVYLYAFSTASSNATLPKTLETAEMKLGLKPEISRFVLTVGSTANQNGTALFEGITVLFLAQVYGIHLEVSQQLLVVIMSILAGIGTAGVPGGSLPLIMIVMQNVGIPAEGIGLILGVDRFLDMCRTTLNVSGDLVIAALVEGRVKRSS